MIYRHNDDIDPSKKYVLSEADNVLLPAVYLTIQSLEKSSTLNKNFREACVDQLNTFLSTHRSIVLLLNQEKSDPVIGGDALSLCREQVEKVFAISLLCEDHLHWTMIYIKDHWRRMFERYLLEKAEREGISRCQGSYQQLYARIEKIRTGLGISEKVRDLVEYRFNCPNTPKSKLPNRLQGVKVPEVFPTPGNVINNVSGTKHDFLQRWQREYRFFCDFSHCGMGKMQVHRVFNPDFSYPEAEKREFYSKEIDNAAAVSHVATASACTELVKVLGSNCTDSIVKVSELWDFLCPRVLLAKAMWGLRARHILPNIEFGTVIDYKAES
jgi:hypothetical protein